MFLNLTGVQFLPSLFRFVVSEQLLSEYYNKIKHRSESGFFGISLCKIIIYLQLCRSILKSTKNQCNICIYVLLVKLKSSKECVCVTFLLCFIISYRVSIRAGVFLTNIKRENVNCCTTFTPLRNIHIFLKTFFKDKRAD